MIEAPERAIASFPLELDGIGIVFFSPFAAAHIANGEDYLEARYTTRSDVAEHVNSCALPGFCTGSPGSYLIAVFGGVAPTSAVESSHFALRLGVEVRGGQLHFRDLYDLMRWDPATPVAQVVSLGDGFYTVTVLTSLPASGLAGDGQQIHMYFEWKPSKPPLNWDGVPLLCE